MNAPGSFYTARFLKGGAVFEKEFSGYDYQYRSACIPDFPCSAGSADSGSVQGISAGITDCMTFYLLISSVVKLKSEDKQKTQVIEQAKIIVPYCLMIVVYLFLMNKIGYIASTVVFMLASLIYLKLKNKVLMVILTVALTVVVYFVFTNFLTVILPRGSWFNIAF